MGAIIRNGIDYSGLINASGVFIDTSKVIKANTTFRNSMSYTATEDCVFVSYLLANTDTTIRIDGKWVGGTYASGTVAFPFTCFLKKGQTITSTGNHSSYDSSYMIYGVMQGSNILPDYSTTEHKTGRKWIDGKDIWERTFSFTFTSALADWALFDDSVSYDKLLKSEGVLINSQYGESHPFMPSYSTVPRWVVQNDHKLKYYTNENTTRTGYITVQYTKV